MKGEEMEREKLKKGEERKRKRRRKFSHIQNTSEEQIDRIMSPKIFSALF